MAGCVMPGADAETEAAPRFSPHDQQRVEHAFTDSAMDRASRR